MIEDLLELGEEVEHPGTGLLQLVRRVVYGAVFSYADACETEPVVPAPVPFRVGASIDARLNLILVGLQLVEYPLRQIVVVRLNVEGYPAIVRPFEGCRVTPCRSEGPKRSPFPKPAPGSSAISG